MFNTLSRRSLFAGLLGLLWRPRAKIVYSTADRDRLGPMIVTDRFGVPIRYARWCNIRTGEVEQLKCDAFGPCIDYERNELIWERRVYAAPLTVTPTAATHV